MRLQVFLSHSGVCSRRKAFISIQSGRVCVNGGVCLEPSTKIDPECDKVTFCNRNVSLKKKRYILLNKPAGVVSTSKDRFAEKTVLDLIPEEFRHLYPVGRLDKETTGLLLLTNDGILAQHLTHPSFETEKVYFVVLNKGLLPQDRERFEKGIVLEGQKTAPCKIIPKTARELEVVLHEGRKRQIRKMFALLHYHVETLVRIRESFLKLGDLKPGQWRFLTNEEIKRLTAELKMEPPRPATVFRSGR